MSFDPLQTGNLVNTDQPVLLEHLGPVIEVLTGPGAPSSAPGLARGTIRPHAFVPIHSHEDPETFFVLDGVLQGLVYTDQGPQWQSIEAGQAFHLPPNARHALRNASSSPASTLIISTPDLMRFFEETGEPVPSVDATPPLTDERLGRFADASQRHGYYIAPPDENAVVGLTIPSLDGPT